MNDLSERLARLTPEQRSILAQRLRDKAPKAATRPPIGRADRTGLLPLSFAQQRLWFLSQFEPDSPFYNMAEALRIAGAMDVQVVGRVLTALVARHEVLRTRFVTRDGQGFQEVLPPSSPAVALDDLTNLPSAEREPRARRLAADEARRPFDLEHDLPVRLRIVRLDANDHVLLLTVHHIACDGWSMGILIREFGLLYQGFSNARLTTLPELPLQYADYAAWQVGWMQGALLEAELEYWKAKLGGHVPTLELCVDRVRPAVQTYRGAACTLTLPAPLTRAARALARGEGTTLFMLLLAAFDALLHRYSGQGAILVGTPVAGRTQRELEGLVGFFVNTLVMRADVEPHLSFRALLHAVRRDALGAYDHQGLPFEYLVNALQPVRDTSHSPVFQVMFTTQGGLTDVGQASSLHLAPFGGSEKAAKFDLTLAVTETRDALVATLDYNVDLFARARMERLLEHYRTLLQAAVQQPDVPVGALPLLSDDERAGLLHIESAAALAPTACVHGLIEAQARLRPDALAAVFEERRWTYAELDRHAARVAARLRVAGAGPETIVAVCCRRSLELLAALLGVLKVGAAYLPLDVATPPERMREILKDAGAHLVLVDAQGAARLPAEGPTGLRVDLAADDAASAPVHAAQVRPDQLAYVIYTSGSSGTPKGVMVTHGALAERATRLAARYGFDDATRLLQFVSPAFDAFGEELYPTLLAGGSLVVLPDPAALTPVELLDACEQAGVTALHVPPVYAQPCLHELAAAGRRVASVRIFITGGEAPAPAMLANWAALAAPGARFLNAYGPTECTITATTYEAPLQDAEQLAALTRVPIGRPLPNVKAYVLDPGFELVPVGNAGELYLGGVGLARGYLRRPDLTAELFVPDPFGTRGERLYRTGDRVRRSERGDLEFLGRDDEQVKIRGHRIELGEIEAALSAARGVRDAAVVARASADGRTRLVAYVVSDEAADWSDSERRLRATLAARLPEYMLPSAWVQLEQMPRTRHGKLDRRALPAPPEHEQPRETLVAPRNAAETCLAAIWSEVLRRPALGVNSNFFECGGDSILAIQVVSRAARAGLRFTVKQLFQHQTIAELCALAASDGAQQERNEQGEVCGALPLLPIQRWFFEQRFARREHFNQALLLDVGEALEEPALRTAVAGLLRHHDALRITFRETVAGWEQHNQGFDGAVSLHLEDLAGAEPWRDELTRRCSVWQQSFDLEQGPLLRVVWFRGLPENAARLLVVAHHLVVDGVSWRILLEDLERAYAQAASGAPVALDAKTASYKRWAEWLGEHARSASLVQEQEYWLAQASGNPDPEPASEDLAAAGAGIDTVAMELGEDDTRSLLHEPARAYGAEINHVLLAAFAQAVTRVTGQRDVRVELESHGRQELPGAPDVTRTVGWFTTQYPVRLEAPAGLSPGDLLCEVKERLRQVPNGGLGYGLLRHGDDAALAERLARGGRADASFNYLGVLDQGGAQAARFRLARESAGPTRSGLERLPCRYLVNGHVLGGRLRVFLSFDALPGRRQQVEAIARAYKTALEQLVEHCRLPGSGGYTPSDFPLARLDRAQLTRLFGNERGVEDLYPLSPMQQGLLFHSLYAPSSGVYLEQLSCAIDGRFDLAAFQRAWERVLERHAILRTSFLWDGLDQPLQAVRRHASLPLTVLDWRERTPTEQATDWARLVSDDRRQDFDLSQAPLMRLCLARLSADRVRFCWTFHHALQDGWSGPILLQEVVACYQAYAEGREPHLEPACPYRDYIAWLQRQDTAGAEAFWRRELSGFAAPTPLGIERGHDAHGVDGARSGVVSVDLTEAQSRALDAALRARGLTQATLMNGAFGLLLSRYSGERDVLFGATVSGRPSELPNIERTVGLFINTLPVRVRVLPGEPVVAWLLKIQERQAEARQYDYTPLVQVQGWSELPRTTPLFQTIVALQNYPHTASTSGDDGGLRPAVVLSDIAVAEETNYPLSLLVMPHARLRVQLTYDRRVLDDAAVARMARHLANLFVELATHLDEPVASVSMLETDEHTRLLGAWVATDTDDHTRPGALELFEQQVRDVPQATAVVWGEVEWSYAELGRRVERLADELRARGVGPERGVGLLMERSPEMLVGIFGTLAAGGFYVPLDPAYPRDWLRRALDDLDLRVLVCSARSAGGHRRRAEGEGAASPLDLNTTTSDAACDATSALVAELPVERVLHLDALWAAAAAHPARSIRAAAGPDNAAYMIFTSGSTGVPKGVVVTRRSLANFVHAGIANHTPITTYLLLSSFAFDSSMCGIFWTLCSGRRLCLPPPGFELDAQGLAELVAEQQVTHLLCVPSLYGLLLEHADPTRLRSLDTVIVAGEACSAALVARHRAVLPGVILSNEYGPTEGTCWSTTYDTAAHDGAALVPIGRPIANVRTYVLDAHLELLPIGARGELFIGGVNVARGYLHRPELTAERFLPDPFSPDPGARLYRTGDAVRHGQHGDLEFFGRVDGQVKVRGYRIEVGEVEAVLQRQVGVAEAAVCVRDQGGLATLVAYVIPTPTAALDGLVAGLRHGARSALPDFMVPAEFNVVSALPRSPNGKLDRRALAHLGASPAVLAVASQPAESIEARLLEVWREVLRQPELDLGSDFFASGGHSLLAVNLVARVSREFDVRLRLSSLFEAPTAAALAERVRQELSGALRADFASASGVLVPMRTEGDLAPLFCVHPRGGGVLCYTALAQLLAPRRPVYGLQPRGLAGRDEPHRRIEAMAACYIDELRIVQPTGPYRLAGWSLGGLIAFEMAQQLVHTGQTVAFLGLIDTHNIPLERAPEGVDDVSALLRALGQRLRLRAERLVGLSVAEQRHYVLERAREARVAPDLLAHLERQLEVWQAEGEAAHHYVPLPYAGSITLFRASERDEHVKAIAGDDLGWVGLGALEVCEVPGDHNTVLKSPHVQVLVQRLTERLERVEAPWGAATRA